MSANNDIESIRTTYFSAKSSIYEESLEALQIVDRFGFIKNADEYVEDKGDEKESKRALKWAKMLKKIKERKKNHKKLVKRLFKGIPSCVKMSAWSLFLEEIDIGKIKYSDYSGPSEYEKQIDLDIERTLRDHVNYKERFGTGQAQLFRILVAFSNYCPEVGYCQGMSTITAFLLMYFEEEDAFYKLCKIFKRNELYKLFSTGFEKLFETFKIQESFMKELIPKIYKRLVKMDIPCSIYAPKWYLLLFLQIPYHTSLRIWDLFLFYGFDILIVCGISLLKYFEKVLLKMGYEQTIIFLTQMDDQVINDDQFIGICKKYWKMLRKPHRKSPKKDQDRLKTEIIEMVDLSNLKIKTE